MSRCAQNHRSRYSEMSEKHLSEIRIDRFTVFGVNNFYCSVAKGKSHQISAESFVDFKRYKRRNKLGYFMTRLPCKVISVTCRTCSGIRKTARCDNYLIGINNITVFGFNASDFVILNNKLCCSAV